MVIYIYVAHLMLFFGAFFSDSLAISANGRQPTEAYAFLNIRAPE